MDTPPSDLTLSVEPAAAPEDIAAVLAGLRAFNVARIGDPDERPVHVFMRDADGTIVGGLVGVIKWRWMYVAKFWMDDRWRGQGAGTRLLDAAEDYARQHGATDAYLDTFGFQARPFYEKQGYRLIGTLEGFPPGSCQYFLTKSLQR